MGHVHVTLCRKKRNLAPVRLTAQFCGNNVTKLWKILQSHEIKNIHATFLVYLRNFVSLESQFCFVISQFSVIFATIL